MEIIFYIYILPIIVSSILLYVVYDDDSPMTLGKFLNQFKYMLIPGIPIVVIIAYIFISVGSLHSISRMGKYISTKWNKVMDFKIK